MPDTFADGFFAGKRFLICGPGYVGGAVVRALLQHGAHVDVLTRSEARLQAFSATGTAGWVADVAADTWHAQVPSHYEGVLFSVSSGGGGIEGYRRSYAQGMQSLVAWATSRAVRAHLIYTSSTSVYDHDGGTEVDETMAAQVTEERSRILLETEDQTRRWPGAWTILRLAGIYGPERHYLLDNLRDGATTVAGRGDYHLNLAHRDDIVQAVLRSWCVGERSAGEVFNVADDGQARKAEVVDYLAGRLGVAVPIFTGLSAPGRRAHMPDRIIANGKLKAALGWQPSFPTFREGYAAILEA